MHFFRVAAGLDSQIPGDYEIIAQIKNAFMLAKQATKTNGFMEKIFNFALQASKEIKNDIIFRWNDFRCVERSFAIGERQR